jgi:hypothetical protein
MITIVHATMMLGLIVLPLLKTNKKTNKPVVYKNDHDTTDAHYAVNTNGYLEEVSGSKVSSDGFID